MKQDWKPGTMIYPLPAVLVSCGSTEEEYNIITVAWQVQYVPTTHVLYIRTPRTSLLSHSETQYGVCHQPHYQGYAFATDWCGVRSGRDYNKFQEMKLTPGKAKMVSAPIIEESHYASSAV